MVAAMSPCIAGQAVSRCRGLLRAQAGRQVGRVVTAAGLVRCAVGVGGECVGVCVGEFVQILGPPRLEMRIVCVKLAASQAASRRARRKEKMGMLRESECVCGVVWEVKDPLADGVDDPQRDGGYTSRRDKKDHGQDGWSPRRKKEVGPGTYGATNAPDVFCGERVNQGLSPGRGGWIGTVVWRSAEERQQQSTAQRIHHGGTTQRKSDERGGVGIGIETGVTG